MHGGKKTTTTIKEPEKDGDNPRADSPCFAFSVGYARFIAMYLTAFHLRNRVNR